MNSQNSKFILWASSGISSLFSLFFFLFSLFLYTSNSAQAQTLFDLKFSTYPHSQGPMEKMIPLNLSKFHSLFRNNHDLNANINLNLNLNLNYRIQLNEEALTTLKSNRTLLERLNTVDAEGDAQPTTNYLLLNNFVNRYQKTNHLWGYWPLRAGENLDQKLPFPRPQRLLLREGLLVQRAGKGDLGKFKGRILQEVTLKKVRTLLQELQQNGPSEANSEIIKELESFQQDFCRPMGCPLKKEAAIGDLLWEWTGIAGEYADSDSKVSQALCLLENLAATCLSSQGQPNENGDLLNRILNFRRHYRLSRCQKENKIEVQQEKLELVRFSERRDRFQKVEKKFDHLRKLVNEGKILSHLKSIKEISQNLHRLWKHERQYENKDKELRREEKKIIIRQFFPDSLPYVSSHSQSAQATSMYAVNVYMKAIMNRLSKKSYEDLTKKALLKDYEERNRKRSDLHQKNFIRIKKMESELVKLLQQGQKKYQHPSVPSEELEKISTMHSEIKDRQVQRQQKRKSLIQLTLEREELVKKEIQEKIKQLQPSIDNIGQRDDNRKKEEETQAEQDEKNEQEEIEDKIDSVHFYKNLL